MSAAGRAVAAGAALVAGLAGAAGVLHARETRFPQPPPTERLLYLRSGKVADRLFLSFDAVAADVYWIRTIQHYGRDRKSTRTTDRFAQLQPLVDLTTTLDPYFNIAYRFGAIFLAMDEPNGPARPDQAIALLEKGLAKNPNRWQYAHDIAFIHYFYDGDYAAAARWFEKAAAMPGAPEWIRPLIPVTLAQGGDRQGARRMLTELLSSEQLYIRQAAERGLMQINALDGIDQLQALAEQYTAAVGHPPQGWTDLIRAGVLPAIPADDRGKPFVYDPATHTVGLSPESDLNPLPKALGRK